MINPATEEFITEFGPLASAGAVLLDEINRMPLKSQSAFLERLQDRTRSPLVRQSISCRHLVSRSLR